MSDRIRNLQRWINARGGSLVPDGLWGPATRAGLIEVFRNTAAPAVSGREMMAIAERAGCSMRQLAAVAKVEGGGSGWDDAGRLKLLWERHYLWRRVKTWALWTGARQAYLSDPTPGGYTADADRDCINDSWEKLADAAGLFGFDTAAECASVGKFQIMGAHWKALGYASVAEFYWQLSRTEAAHYDAFARFTRVNGLTDALARIDGDPENARAFAKGYNGSAYERGRYHEKIAAAWRSGQ